VSNRKAITIGNVNQVEKEILELAKDRDKMKLEMEQFEKETAAEIETTSKINDLIFKIRRELLQQKVSDRHCFVLLPLERWQLLSLFTGYGSFCMACIEDPHPHRI
jgi:hypothetical protein